MKDCLTCQKRPKPGTPYEQTACAACVLEEPQDEKGRVTFHPGLEEPDHHTWRMMPEPAHTEASDPACALATYLRTDKEGRRAVRRFCTVISLSTEDYLADKAEAPFSGDADVASMRGISRQAANKQMKRIRKEIEEWEDYERERKGRAAGLGA